MLNFLKNKIKKFSGKFLKLKSFLGVKIKKLFSGTIEESSFEELEQILYEADLGVDGATSLVEKLRKELKGKDKVEPEEIINFIKQELSEILSEDDLETKIEHSPHVIMIVGVNGSGKTTSIAKLANMYKKEGKKVLIAAADTFRDAAVEQLTLWAQKINVDIVKSQQKADPAAVVFDALAAAKSRNTDIVLIDTAGRLQNKQELMLELEKIKKVCSKQIPDTPHEIYITLDATTGQNALDQAEIFNKFTPANGIILSKLDGSAKGGIVIAIKQKLNIPVKWIGTGEAIEDLMPFDKKHFIDELLSSKNDEK